MLGFLLPAAAAASPPPIIDMHLHAEGPNDYGPPGGRMCIPYEEWPARDPRRPMTVYLKDFTGSPACARSFASPMTEKEIHDRSIAELERLNIVALTSGDRPERIEQWRRQSPRIIPALSFGSGALPSIASLRALHAAGRLQVMGEITSQYGGMAPDDPALEPYFALAEELDIPVAIHVGPGPPGNAYFSQPKYRAALGDPLRLEPVLIRHPKLRLYAMHAGWPMSDAMIAMLFAHPQLYVDTGIIGYAYRREDFHAYLKRLVDAGFSKRIMFGSDQMIWPEAIAHAVEGIESAPFLTAQQKRDILYNNAARFLRRK